MICDGSKPARSAISTSPIETVSSPAPSRRISRSTARFVSALAAYLIRSGDPAKAAARRAYCRAIVSAS